MSRIIVKSVDNYNGADESINEISSFEVSLSDRTETHLPFFLFWRSRADKSFVWFDSNDGLKVAESLFGRQNEKKKVEKNEKKKVSEQRRNINCVL
jgi:hypothetical protein